MKAVVAAFNQEKALVGAFSVITNLRLELFEALVDNIHQQDPGKLGRTLAYIPVHFPFLSFHPKILSSSCFIVTVHHFNISAITKPEE